MQHVEVGQLTELFGVFTNTDRNEGRGSPVLVCVCENLLTAKDVAKGKGVMGSDADVHNVTVVKANNGKYYVVDSAPIKIFSKPKEYFRERALEKLTEEELELLGLS